MTDADLENRYRAYLDALNERPLGDLADYVQDVLTYNGETVKKGTRGLWTDLRPAEDI